MGLSSLRVRGRLVAALGERGFLGVYTLVAFATFVPLVGFYFSHKHEGPFLWYLGAQPARALAHVRRAWRSCCR